MQRKLPTYFIPNFFVPVEKFKLTANGKVDRKKLLNISIKTESNTKYVAPRNDFEKTFQKVFHMTKIRKSANNQVMHKFIHIIHTIHNILNPSVFKALRGLRDLLF